MCVSCVYLIVRLCVCVVSNFRISLRDGLVIDVSFVCEFKGSSRAPGEWNNGVRRNLDYDIPAFYAIHH